MGAIISKSKGAGVAAYILVLVFAAFYKKSL
jgi:hypothetical protein